VPVNTIELDELVLDELSVTSMRDAAAVPDKTVMISSNCSCCLSNECCCSCYIPEDPG
jgi:hypothetical protein